MVSKFIKLKNRVEQLRDKANFELIESRKLFEDYRIDIEELHEAIDKHNKYKHFLDLINQVENT